MAQSTRQNSATGGKTLMLCCLLRKRLMLCHPCWLRVPLPMLVVQLCFPHKPSHRPRSACSPAALMRVSSHRSNASNCLADQKLKERRGRPVQTSNRAAQRRRHGRYPKLACVRCCCRLVYFCVEVAGRFGAPPQCRRRCVVWQPRPSSGVRPPQSYATTTGRRTCVRSRPTTLGGMRRCPSIGRLRHALFRRSGEENNKVVFAFAFDSELVPQERF